MKHTEVEHTFAQVYIDIHERVKYTCAGQNDGGISKKNAGGRCNNARDALFTQFFAGQAGATGSYQTNARAKTRTTCVVPSVALSLRVKVLCRGA